MKLDPNEIVPARAGHTPLGRRTFSGWGNSPTAVCYFAMPDEPVTDFGNWDAYPSLTPRGLGRSYGDASLAPTDGLVLVTTRQDRIENFDTEQGIITAQAGTPLAKINAATIREGWFLPVTPGTQQVTLGGALAANAHGKNHHHAGAIANFVKRFDIVTETGLIDCSPDQQPDLFRATVGGFGMTGLMQSISVRLKQIESAWVRLHTVKVLDLDHLLAVLAEREARHEYSLVWIDTFAPPRSLGRGIAFFGDHAVAADLPPADRAQSLVARSRRTLPAPQAWQGGFLRAGEPWLARLYYRWPRRAEQLVPLLSYFYPLDAVRDWNRIYGRHGFVQYQCVLPRQHDPSRGLRRILELLARRRIGSFVAGLKSMQTDQVLLPFGMEGYTIGMDFNRRTSDLDALLAEFDRIVIDHGGRVALSKDSRLPACAFREMYPEYSRWIATVRRFAPNGRCQSRLGQRLNW